MRARWLVLAIPLLWAVPLVLSATVIRVYMTAAQGGAAVACGWAAFLGPLVAAGIALARLRPLGVLVILWLALNIVVGFLAFALVAVMSLQT